MDGAAALRESRTAVGAKFSDYAQAANCSCERAWRRNSRKRLTHALAHATELPRVGEMKSRASEAPHGDDEDGSSKSPGAAENNRRLVRENAKGIPYNAKEIPAPFVFF